jgi:apolipoprotein N-acyltransferase
MEPFLTPTRRLLWCLLSALLVWLSFPNFLMKTLHPPTAFLAWVALTPLFLALRGAGPRQGALLGWVFGFAQFGGVLYWIAFLKAAQYLSVPGWLLLVLYLSLYPLCFGWAYSFLRGRLGWGGALGAAVLWTALEYVRGTSPWGGFPWGELGYSQAPYPALLAFSDWGGVYGLTFLLVWFNARLALALFPERTGPAAPFSRLHPLAAPLLVLAVVWGAGRLEIRGKNLRDAGSVSLIQPSIDQDVKWSPENEAKTYDIIDRLVEGIPSPKPGLVVWPETAAPCYLLETPASLERVEKIVKKSGVPQLVGCLDSRTGKDGVLEAFNAAVPFDASGRPLGSYHKRHLVPFGEFVPFQKYLSFLGPVVGDLGDFVPGGRYETFQAEGFSYAPMICYEAVFPGDVRLALKKGADALVNISNDAWYGRTAAAYQHALMAVACSAEERKPLLRAANTGISLVTDPFGRILAATGLFERRTLRGEVWTASEGPSLYARWGNWLPRLCLILAILALLGGRLGGRRAGGEGGDLAP